MAFRDWSSGETNVQDREALVCAGNLHSKRAFVRLGFPGTRHRTDSPQSTVDIHAPAFAFLLHILRSVRICNSNGLCLPQMLSTKWLTLAS